MLVVGLGAGVLHFGIAQLELDLADLVGRSVDLRTLGDRSRYFRDEVAAEARALMTPPDDLVRLRHLRDAAEKAIKFSAGTKHRRGRPTSAAQGSATSLVGRDERHALDTNTMASGS